jgi:competence protein ComEC
VLRVSYGAHRFLLTGDAEREEEAWLLEHYEHEALRADVLKLGHHGSRTSSSPPFLDAVEPRVTVASVGTGNRYGHPSPETLAALLAREVPVFRTDRLGSVVLRSNGRTLSVEAGGETWDVPPRAVGLIRAPPTPVVR